MLNMEWVIEKIKRDGNSTISGILNDLIKDHEPKKDKMIANYKRYKASLDSDGVPIFTREFKDSPQKINRKDNNAFDADVIDVKIGYMLGNPIIYELDKRNYTEVVEDGEDIFDEKRYAMDFKVIEEFNTRNDVEDIDGETEKMASICGYSARLLYIDTDGKERVKNINPWECIFINDGSLNEAQYAMRYYEIIINEKPFTYVEWYDDKNITFYISAESSGSTTSDMTFHLYEGKEGNNPMSHMFDGIPMIQFKNNEEVQGDCDKVYNLIDDYDFTLSDVASEIEQFRLAYMAMYGVSIDDDDLEKAKKTGVFSFPEENSRMEFITKTLDDAVVEHHLDRLEENIYRFAKSVNFNDEAFGGNVSGIAMKFKMFALESKCIISERKFDAALRTQYKILGSAWAIKGTDIDYLMMVFIWTRNFPLNLLDEAKTAQLMKGIIPDELLFSLMSFIDDPKKVVEQMAEQQEGMIDMDAPLELDDEGDDE